MCLRSVQRERSEGEGRGEERRMRRGGQGGEKEEGERRTRREGRERGEGPGYYIV